MIDYRKLSKILEKQYIGHIHGSFPNGKDCGFLKLTFYYIMIIEVEKDFDIGYGFHFDKEMNFLGYAYVPGKRVKERNLSSIKVINPVVSVTS